MNIPTNGMDNRGGSGDKRTYGHKETTSEATLEGSSIVDVVVQR